MNSKILFVKRNGDFHYPICFESDFSALAKALKEEGLSGRRICLVADDTVASLYLDAVFRAMAPVCQDIFSFTFPAGEASKNLDTVQDLYTVLIEHGMDRQGLLAALGGGVTGDLTGFAAATYLRGIDFIQIPTTLLAQVDSSVGGKTGVDFRGYKNMAGAFWQPRLVYMNLSVLSTLSEEQFACGMGEVLKTGLICDIALFQGVCARHQAVQERDPLVMAELIRRCCEIKAGIVERDPKEKGERALLNLGHTIGHAIEKLKNFELLHGQCVALGLIASAEISRLRGYLTDQEVGEIRQALESFRLPVSVSGLDEETVLQATRKDKKMKDGQIRFILMKKPGSSFIDPTVTDRELRQGIRAVLRA